MEMRRIGQQGKKANSIGRRILILWETLLELFNRAPTTLCDLARLIFCRTPVNLIPPSARRRFCAPMGCGYSRPVPKKKNAKPEPSLRTVALDGQVGGQEDICKIDDLIVIDTERPSRVILL
jgi:hypothetical protein